MIGLGPPAGYVFAHFRASSYAARATATAPMPATGPDHAKLRLISRSPLPLAPSIMFSAGTRALSNVISKFGAERCPSVLMLSYVTPAVPRSTMIADRPSVPPTLESVRQTTRFRFAPLLSQPPTLQGQYFLPFMT